MSTFEKQIAEIGYDEILYNEQLKKKLEVEFCKARKVLKKFWFGALLELTFLGLVILLLIK